MSLQALCEKHKIRFKKGLGQNLLLDENMNRIMADAATLGPEDDVLEVGAGLGALTAELSKRARRVLAVEIDRSFLPCLDERFSETQNVILFRGDILNHDLGKLVAEHLPGAESLNMASNLPYYITTPILFHFWESPVYFRCMVVMLQEEVARRMTAPVGSSEYGALSLAARYFADADIMRRTPRTCFRPMPQVDSCIVRLRCRAEPLYPDIEGAFLMKVVRAAFARRRKMLRNTLAAAGGLGANRQAVQDALEAADIDPRRRPQTLSLDEFARVARELRARLTT